MWYQASINLYCILHELKHSHITATKLLIDSRG